jgi:hypothetical protein
VSSGVFSAARAEKLQAGRFIGHISPCGGGIEYFHRSPASRKRRQKGNSVPWVITGPPSS